MSTTVGIVVLGDWDTPDGGTPTGEVVFQLSQPILVPEAVTPRTVVATLQGGQLAQELAALDVDSAGAPLIPGGLTYAVKERLLGSPEQDYMIVVPAVPPGSRTVHDGVATLGTATLTSATAAFTAADLGAYVNVPGFPVGTQIGVVTSGTTVQLSQTCSASGSGLAVLIGASVSLAALRPLTV